MKSILASLTVILLVSGQAMFAGSATWNINPTNDWNTATNWRPQTVPNSPDDVATFDSTNGHTPMISSDVELDTLLLTENAPAPMTITVGDSSGASVGSLTLSGAGLVNHTNFIQLYAQILQAAPTLITNGAHNIVYFKNSAGVTTGSGRTSTTLSAQRGTSSDLVGGQFQFLDNSNASEPGWFSSIVAEGGADGGGGGEISFFDNSSAGDAYVYIFPSDSGSSPGTTSFEGNSTAATAFLSMKGAGETGGLGGATNFRNSSTAADAYIEVQGGSNGGAGANVFLG